MRNLFLLLKNNFNTFLGKLQKGKKRASNIAMLGVLVFFCLVIFGLYSYSAYISFTSVAGSGFEPVTLFQACRTALLGILLIGLIRPATNAKFSDEEFLLSLPIKKSIIITSKAISKYTFDLFFSFLFLLPYIVLSQIFIGFNILTLILGVLLIFLLPLLSVGLSYIFNFIITRLFNKFKYGNIIKTILYVIIFIIVMVISLFATPSQIPDINNLQAYFNASPITNILFSFIYSPSLVNILLLLFLTFIPFISGLLLFALNFGKSFGVYQSKNKTLIFGSGKNGTSLLIKKEIKRYFNCVPYLLNTIVGAVMILLAVGYLCISGMQNFSLLLSYLMPIELLPGVLCIAMCSMLASSQISASSISLEGKNWWFIKSSPIKEEQLIFSKAITHFIVLEPFVIIASIALLIFAKLSLLQFAIILTLPTLFILINSFFGVFINSLIPNLNYESEEKVVKSSMAMTFSMLLAIIVAIIPIGIYLLFPTLAINYLFLISLMAYVAILTLSIILAFTIGKKAIKKIY